MLAEQNIFGYSMSRLNGGSMKKRKYLKVPEREIAPWHFGRSLSLALAIREIRVTDFARAMRVRPQTVSIWKKTAECNTLRMRAACLILRMRCSDFVALSEEEHEN
jgi:hypothetical protein